MNTHLRPVVNRDLGMYDFYRRSAQAPERAGRIDSARACLETAHILGQRKARKTKLHVRALYSMWALALAHRDREELLGQTSETTRGSLGARTAGNTRVAVQAADGCPRTWPSGLAGSGKDRLQAGGRSKQTGITRPGLPWMSVTLSAQNK